MINKLPVMRLCIACRKTYDRENLLKITNDHQIGIILNKGMGRSAYICKTKKCYTHPKIKKKLQKALKMSFEPEFFDNFEKEIAKYNYLSPIKEYN